MQSPPATAADTDEIDPDAARESVSQGLVRKLRTRPLSVTEARQVLRGHHLHPETSTM